LHFLLHDRVLEEQRDFQLEYANREFQVSRLPVRD